MTLEIDGPMRDRIAAAQAVLAAVAGGPEAEALVTLPAGWVVAFHTRAAAYAIEAVGALEETADVDGLTGGVEAAIGRAWAEMTCE